MPDVAVSLAVGATVGAMIPSDRREKAVNSAKDLDFIGAARGIRTPDPIITNDVLYQLSYCGVRGISARGFLLSARRGFFKRLGCKNLRPRPRQP